MPSRREFIQAVAALAGAAGIPDSIRRAGAIEPEPGTSVLDAEHVVILMQENRSFDHLYGSLRGVRGFNDPRAVTLPDGHPVWVQADTDGKQYVPFRLDVKRTKSTWMGSLPHSWPNQIDAANGGKHDRWIPSKRSGHKAYAALPLTLGYYTREDLPVYYALADTFTVCDQHFCSSLTGTTPNRLHLWTGTVREKPTPDSTANVRNENVDYGRWASWTTFPERLEEHGVSWKIYQNEISLTSGLSGEHDAWLANFSDNPIEWFRQYHVQFAASHRQYLAEQVAALSGQLAAAEKAKAGEKVAALTTKLRKAKAEAAEWSKEKFDALSPRQKSLHDRAFSTNSGDPAHRQLAEISYREGNEKRTVAVPKGDVLFQFRKDVRDGMLPTVSWIVPPERFSDHPSSAWYGAWYLAEVLDILTKDPAVWKKTVFILTYDENDGYFDHVPPFAPPAPNRPETGRTTKGIDTAVEYVTLAQDRKHNSAAQSREGPIGLGFRVPLVIASPWSRGGWVNSQVCDHTSVLQFLEKLLTHKTGKKIEETNVTAWRRVVCGDLLSAFQPAPVAGQKLADFPSRDEFVEQIHRAKYKPVPTHPAPLTPEEIERVQKSPDKSRLPRQEPGVRPSCPLPYQLVADGALGPNRTSFVLHFEAKMDQFGNRAAGSPFTAYASTKDGMTIRRYAVGAGESLDDAWDLSAFEKGRYNIRVYGPNGFFREFIGERKDPLVRVTVEGSFVRLVNRDRAAQSVAIRDRSYGKPDVRFVLAAGEDVRLPVGDDEQFGWYDIGVTLDASPGFARRFAGRVETGRPTCSDPAMGA
ncbi:MAG TPA: phospholipase C, phosphocholine-specific [Fimbriiglobus sp.]|jgi:phospholipase C